MKKLSRFKPNSSRFSWWQYLFSFVLFSALTVLPVLMFSGWNMIIYRKICHLVFPVLSSCCADSLPCDRLPKISGS